jgi:hypothetical protein
MSALSDTVTVGLVLILLFGSACLYLYTRIQQSESKINLLESILLDLKMSNELKAYPNIPSYHPASQDSEFASVEVQDVPSTNIKPFVDDENGDEVGNADAVTNVDANTDASGILAGSSSVSPKVSKVSANYEAMTLKELQALAKERGLSGTSSMRRAQVIQALKDSDDTHVHVLDALIEGNVSSSA